MKPGGGSAKGGEFERWVSKSLSLWATHGDATDVFWRSAGSGSRGTLRRSKSQLGDICTVTELGHRLTSHVIIECKHYRRLDWMRWMLYGRGELADFWWKLSAQCDEHHRIPMLVVKENKRDTLLAVGRDIRPLVGQPMLMVLPRVAVQPRVVCLYGFAEFLDIDYDRFTRRLGIIPYEPATYHRPAPDRPPRARIPLAVPRVALRRRPQPQD